MPQQRFDVLADIVIARAFPKILCVLVVMFQRASGDFVQIPRTQFRFSHFLIAISIIAFPRKRIPTRTHLYAAREEVYPIIDDWQPMRAGLLKLKS
jgi:hypothetical protein